jgi:hypothetical protein
MNARCYACSMELTPVFDDPERDETYQFDNALVISFEGGYGMFVDVLGVPAEQPKDLERGVLRDVGEHQVIICHDCAHRLCEIVPWIGTLLDPMASHAHSHRHDWTGHDGWDLPHSCPVCAAVTTWGRNRMVCSRDSSHRLR